MFFRGFSWTKHLSWRAIFTWFQHVAELYSKGSGVSDFGRSPRRNGIGASVRPTDADEPSDTSNQQLAICVELEIGEGMRHNERKVLDPQSAFWVALSGCSKGVSGQYNACDWMVVRFARIDIL